MEETRKEFRETLAISQALRSRGKLEEAKAYNEKVNLLFARLDQDMKAEWARLKSDLRKGKIKAGKETMDRKEAENKTIHEKKMAELEADRIKWKAAQEKKMAEGEADRIKWKATQEKEMAEWKANRIKWKATYEKRMAEWEAD
jgi:hypothetical protein